MPIKLPYRQIHLDFHTGSAIPDVGAQWDADTFGDMLAEAHVNSVTLFAKCHHGRLYYDTQSPARHPSLPKGLDLLGEQIDALHKRNIAAPVYISVQCDEYAADTHPDWIALNPDGSRVGRKPLDCNPFSWQILDMSSPYADYLAEQIDEVCKKYRPLDGLFLDMCWDQPSVSNWAKAGMIQQGLNPVNENDRNTYARWVVHQYMARYNKILAKYHKKAPKVYYNSRPKVNLPGEKKYLQHIEIEALPTGGWGYTYFPLNVRFARNFGLPAIGMTGRFHKSWADFGGLKPHAALLYECTQMLAHGCGCSVGDQLHPRGTLDRAAYQRIGSVYQHVQACEPWCIDAQPVTQIGVLRSLDTKQYHVKPGDAPEGVVRALQQLAHQFDFVHTDSRFDDYEVIIVPDGYEVDDTLVAKLQKYVADGGAILFSGTAGVDSDGKPWLKEQGIENLGASPFTVTYLRLDQADWGELLATDHVMYEPGLRLALKHKNAVGIGKVIEPYFERAWNHFCSHAQTPTDKASRYPIAVQCGRVITSAYPLFKAYAAHGTQSCRQVIAACLNRLLPEQLTQWHGPKHVEITVTTQQTGRSDQRTIVHVLSFVPARRTPTLDIVEEPTPLVNAQLSLMLPRAPQQVTLQPTGKTLPFDYVNGRAIVTLTSAHGHDMIVFE